ncbi:neurotrimin-like isoform X2 [Ruditapes philippinarum]|uniref:neurotrimin-like isoform X2 n=1 Tax=Ruditapes philippinarum TaxID=129788 RepID=UPI00295BCD93|nr:neurotrimin-like isoform X2 [Ruditapes philippinarum]
MKTSLAMLFVQAIWPVMIGGQPPEFDSKPINVTAIKGQPAVLPCTVINKNDYLIVWMNPRRTLLSSDDRRVIDDTRMSIERPFVRDWNLHIRHVQVHDDGEYTCQINTDPIQIKRILLKVQVPAEIDNTSSSVDTTVREGQTVKLQCVATGIPEPSISWYRNTLQTNQEKEHVGHTGEILIIHNISRYCGGQYECQASNNIAQPVHRVMNVEVEFPPEVTFKTKKISQPIGKEGMLECLIAAFPHGVGSWSKNGKPVGEMANDNRKYTTYVYKEDHFTYAIYLSIINLEVHDFGLYTCEASNALGTDSDTILLSEYFEPTPPPTTIPRDPFQPSRQPPLVVGVGHRDNDNIPDSDGIIGVGEGYKSSSDSSIIKQTTTLLRVQTVVFVTLFILRELFPS